MKFLIVLIFLCFLLTTCEQKIYYDIPQNDKPLFSNNDTIVFINNTNKKLDKFIVQVYNVYEVQDKRYYHERIIIKYNDINTNSTYKSFSVSHMTATSISIDGNYFPPITKMDTTINMTIGNTNYNSVYSIYNLDMPDNLPKLMYYSHRHGIIQYQFSDSNYYEIVEDSN